jgi:hypothetical protein
MAWRGQDEGAARSTGEDARAYIGACFPWLLFRAAAEYQFPRIPAVHSLIEVAWFGLSHCRRLVALMLRKALFDSLPQIAIVQKAEQFGTVHSVEALQQRAFQQIFVFHSIPRGLGPLKL